MTNPVIGVAYWESGGNRVKQSAFDQLESWATVDRLDPEQEHGDIGERGYDLYHMAKRRLGSLCDLNRAAQAGVPTVNPPDPAWLTSDRLARATLLDAHGVPVPLYAFGTGDGIGLPPPLIVKPRWEWTANAHEFHVIRDGPVAFEDQQFVERYLSYDRVLKTYAVGDAVRTVVGVRGPHEISPPQPVTSLVTQVQNIFDLSVFEVDIAVAGDSLVVIDVNPAVSLAGIDDVEAVSLYQQVLRHHCDTGPNQERSTRTVEQSVARQEAAPSRQRPSPGRSGPSESL